MKILVVLTLTAIALFYCILLMTTICTSVWEWVATSMPTKPTSDTRSRSDETIFVGARPLRNVSSGCPDGYLALITSSPPSPNNGWWVTVTGEYVIDWSDPNHPIIKSGPDGGKLVRGDRNADMTERDFDGPDTTPERID